MLGEGQLVDMPNDDDLEDAAVAETLARDLLRQQAPLQSANILPWLQALPFPRKGRSVNSSYTRGFCVGAVKNGPFCFVTKFTAQLPNSVQLLHKLAMQEIRVPYTAIQLNKGVNHGPSLEPFQTAHTDGNSSPNHNQAIAAYGDFLGGEICVAQRFADGREASAPLLPNCGLVSIRVPDTGPVGSYSRGTIVQAAKYDLRGVFLEYNPHLLHVPMGFQGTRFSIIYFLSNLREGNGQADFNRDKIIQFAAAGFSVTSLQALGFSTTSTPVCSPSPNPTSRRFSPYERPGGLGRDSESQGSALGHPCPLRFVEQVQQRLAEDVDADLA